MRSSERGSAAIPALIHGCWQLSEGHRPGPWPPPGTAQALAELALDAASPIAFDCADIYTGVEPLLGEARRLFLKGGGSEADFRIHTKFVPDLDRLSSIDRDEVRAAIQRSRDRLGVDALDLVQFHWWDGRIDRYKGVALWLAEMVEEGIIATLGGTNFTSPMLEEILSAGVPLRTHQVQYSLLDQRAGQRMTELCERYGVELLCYGAAAGGFLGERWLERADPEDQVANRSLTKYRLVIEEAGGWPAFQSLLGGLGAVAGRSPWALAAAAWVLAQPCVRSVILGWRDLESAREARQWLLDDNFPEGQALRLAMKNFDPTKHCSPLRGDVYALERTPGRHSAIMKYNLNADPSH